VVRCKEPSSGEGSNLSTPAISVNHVVRALDSRLPKRGNEPYGEVSKGEPIMNATDTITLAEAYDAMRVFLEGVRQRRGTSEQLERLIGALKWADGTPVDPAAWPDWLRAVEVAKSRRAP
jgi:hypothetical protein